MTTRLLVLASGNGSNLQAIIDACETQVLQAQVIGVVSDNPNAYALSRAAQHNIASKVVDPANLNKHEFNAQLASAVVEFHPDIVVLAGFMRLLTNNFLARVSQQIINVHPALPGELPGTGAIERAFAQFVAGERSQSGVMVHFVTDEGIDSGPVICKDTVAFLAGDTLQTFSQRMHETEHRLLVDALLITIPQTQKATTP